VAAPGADTTTPHGQLMLTILGGLAEFERTLIRARTGEGLERAKARGVRFAKQWTGSRPEKWPAGSVWTEQPCIGSSRKRRSDGFVGLSRKGDLDRLITVSISDCSISPAPAALAKHANKAFSPASVMFLP
jgi:hypothetical protein